MSGGTACGRHRWSGGTGYSGTNGHLFLIWMVRGTIGSMHDWPFTERVGEYAQRMIALKMHINRCIRDSPPYPTCSGSRFIAGNLTLEIQPRVDLVRFTQNSVPLSQSLYKKVIATVSKFLKGASPCLHQPQRTSLLSRVNKRLISELHSYCVVGGGGDQLI